MKKLLTGCAERSLLENTRVSAQVYRTVAGTPSQKERISFTMKGVVSTSVTILSYCYGTFDNKEFYHAVYRWSTVFLYSNK